MKPTTQFIGTSDAAQALKGLIASMANSNATVMITGDNPLTAATIAGEAGVDEFVAEAKPEDKLRIIREQRPVGWGAAARTMLPWEEWSDKARADAVADGEEP